MGLARLAFGLILIAAGPTLAQQSNELSTELDRLTDLAARGMPNRAERWDCDIQVQFVCSAKGCEKVAPSIQLRIDFPSETYQRCDGQGCDAHSMFASVAGIYTTISQVGSFLKALNDGSEFVEVATLGTSTWNGFGMCMSK